MIKYIITALLALLYIGATAQGNSKVTLSGYITETDNGEALINATMYIDAIGSGTVSNTYGFYSITLDPGTYDVKVSYLGFEDKVLTVDLSANKTLDIDLGNANNLIEEIIISADSETEDDNVEEVGMSQVRVDVKQVQKMPALMGEVDIIKAIQLLPGVATVGEGTSGFYVRGGNVDQNLILLDEAPVYNASHLLGFFSVFNPDAIKDMQLYKGAIPAEYGGRLSSVLDIKMKEGNSKRFAGNAGIGTVSSRLTLEAPISDNGSFMISGRRTYVDVFLAFAKDTAVRDNKLFFYDLNAKLNYKLGEKDRIFLSAYTGRDVFNQSDEFQTDWGNKTTTLRWNHLFSPKLFSNLTLYASDFDYFLGAEDGAGSFEWISNLKDYGLKYNFGMYLSPKSTLKFGMEAIIHHVEPGFAKGVGQESVLSELNIDNSKSLENAMYISHEQEIGDKMKIQYGVRFSALQNVGPGDIFTYGPDYNVIDTTSYVKNDIYNSYINFEPRLGLKYSLGRNTSFKMSYNRTTQYIQLASNSTSSSPLDIWFPSSPTVKPQQADQVALGIFKNIDDNTIEASAEVYYKKFHNAVDFKDHAELLLNQQLEGELRFGEARAYGLELLVRKNAGKLTGWVAYTLSKSEKKIADINNGNWYNAKFDKTHDLAIVASYDINPQFNVSANWVYGTGAAVTLPTGKYTHLGRSIPVFSERNGERMPTYHRADLSLTWNRKKKLFKAANQSWLFSVYNIYGRKNAYSINFKESAEDPNKTIAEKTYLFGIIPSITYNLTF